MENTLETNLIVDPEATGAIPRGPYQLAMDAVSENVVGVDQVSPPERFD